MNILIIGANSLIAAAYAKRQANVGNNIYLIGRNSKRLETLHQDLEVRGANSVNSTVTDLNKTQQHQALIQEAFEQFNHFDIALIAHGSLPDQQECQADITRALKEFHLNATVTISLMSHLANFMEKAQQGTLALITSVAGDRGRPSNYFYGAAKSAVSTAIEGIRGRLYTSNIHVTEIKPGFVDTPMIQHMNPPQLLLSQPEDIAEIIEKSILKKSHCAYAPSYWRFIMLTIRIIPIALFKRISI